MKSQTGRGWVWCFVCVCVCLVSVCLVSVFAPAFAEDGGWVSKTPDATTRPGKWPPTRPSTTGAPSTTGTPSAASSPGTGMLKIEIRAATTPELKIAEALARSSKTIEIAVSEMNKAVKLPRDILVVFDACGESNAFYSADDLQILICYELIAEARDLFLSDPDTKSEAGVYAMESALFMFLHELGHALVDQLKIPITGKEEDAVDDLAAILMLEKPEGGEAVLSAMEHFWLEADEELASAMDELEFWDEHSLSIQRVYSMACLLYGSDPDGYEDLLVGDDDEGLLPSERAELCPDEYALKKRSWSVLLKDHMRVPAL